MYVKGREPEFDEKVNVKGEMKEHLNTKMVLDGEQNFKYSKLI